MYRIATQLYNLEEDLSLSSRFHQQEARSLIYDIDIYSCFMDHS